MSSVGEKFLRRVKRQQRGLKNRRKFPSFVVVYLAHRKLAGIAALLDVSLIHHQSPSAFGKQPEHPKNSAFLHQLFWMGFRKTAVSAVIEYPFSKSPVAGQSSQYSGVFAAPPILRGKVSDGGHVRRRRHVRNDFKVPQNFGLAPPFSVHGERGLGG
jgi:hypothetical protein